LREGSTSGYAKGGKSQHCFVEKFAHR